MALLITAMALVISFATAMWQNRNSQNIATRQELLDLERRVTPLLGRDDD